MQDEQPDQLKETKPKKKISVSIDSRVIILLLLIVIGGMLWMWKPWEEEPVTDRTISITGQSTVKAVPDEFVFSPTYQFKNADKQTAVNELTKKGGEISAKLKEIGVSDNHIKSNSDGYNNSFYYYRQDGTYTYTLRMTITADSKEQAQKVQDYLVTTDTEGAISPVANFSDNKRKDLENQARDEATKDARQKADKSADNLGFKIVSVKSVQDGQNQNYYRVFDDVQGQALQGANTESSASDLKVQPGENDLSYSVTVVYFIR